jgi:hypothetical protein
VRSGEQGWDEKAVLATAGGGVSPASTPMSGEKARRREKRRRREPRGLDERREKRGGGAAARDRGDGSACPRLED